MSYLQLLFLSCNTAYLQGVPLELPPVLLPLVPVLLPLVPLPLPTLLLQVCWKQSLISCSVALPPDAASERHFWKSLQSVLALLLLLLSLLLLVLSLLLLVLSLLSLLSLLLLVVANTGITATLDNAKMAAVTSATIDIVFFVFIAVVVK